MQFSDFFNTEIKDNSFYLLQKESESLFKFSLYNRVNEKKIEIYRRRKWRSDVEASNVLKYISSHLRQKLTDRKFLEKNVYLFNDSEYEHNTLDPFIEYVPGPEGGAHNATIKTGNLVGYVSKKVDEKTHTLVISSRFGDNFLKHIIASTDGFLELPDEGNTSKTGMAEWLLIFLWKVKLKYAYRLGVPKGYVSKTERTVSFRGNLSNKGMITNSALIPPYECTFREHSYHNSLTSLIANTFRLIKNKSLIKDCQKLNRDFITATEGKRLPVVDLLNCHNIKNPYYTDYNVVADLSKKIIKREVADFGKDSDSFSAFLFDISMLFEFFIRKVLIRKGYILEEKKAKGYSIPSGGTYNKGIRYLYPDIVIKHNDGSYSIYDVKYKHFDFKYGVKREDLFQMHTYVAHASSKKTIKNCGFIFPITEEEYKLNDYRNKIEQIIEVGGRVVTFEIKFFVVPEDNEDNYSLSFNNSVYKFFKSEIVI